MPTRIEVGRRIKALRNHKRLYVQEVADVLDVSTATVYNYERGDRYVPDEKKPILAKLFGKTVQSIFFDDDVNY